VVPSFTNEQPVDRHRRPAVSARICGNYLFASPAVPVMMNDPKWLRAPSILAGLRCRRQRRRRHGKGQAAQALGHGMKGICFRRKRPAK
jgi:phosphonoacetate hydrolase